MVSAVRRLFVVGGVERRRAGEGVLCRFVELALGGTSAGAAMMSSTMIVGGDEAGVQTSSVWTGRGMGFLTSGGGSR